MHSRLVPPDHKIEVTPMYALYVTEQGFLVVSLTMEQSMKITLSFCISRVVPKTSNFRVWVNTASRRGIKQLGIYFGSVSNESSRGPLIHTCLRMFRPPALWQPWIRDNFSRNPWLFLMKLRSKTQLPLPFSFLFTYHWTGHKKIYCQFSRGKEQ